MSRGEVSGRGEEVGGDCVGGGVNGGLIPLPNPLTHLHTPTPPLTAPPT